MLRVLVMPKILKVMLVITLGSVLTSGLLMVGCVPTSTQGIEVGNLTPDFQLQSTDGQTVSISSLRGKPVLINFWATWCPPCRSEMPYIQEIYEEWSGKGLVVLAINIGESSTQADGFMQSNNLTFTVLLDTTQKVAQSYNITGIPTTFFVDEDGIIKEKVVGAFPNKAQIEAELSKIMP
ncbi:peroxiredoxin family protein [Chloroflexota bacterium]